MAMDIGALVTRRRVEGIEAAVRDLPRLNERTADNSRRFYDNGAAITRIYLDLNETEADRVAARVRRAWWDLHYNGRPSREDERALALIRFLARSPGDEAEQEAFLSLARR